MVGQAGVPTTPFVVVKKIEDVETVDLPYPLFAKPVAEGTGKGITADSKINDRVRSAGYPGPVSPEPEPVLVKLFCRAASLRSASLARGEDVRVIGSMEITLLPAAEAEVYSYLNKSRYEEFCRYLPRRGPDDPEVAQAE